eukprot:86329-Rhodomonas_salina.1
MPALASRCRWAVRCWPEAQGWWALLSLSLHAERSGCRRTRMCLRCRTDLLASRGAHAWAPAAPLGHEQVQPQA